MTIATELLPADPAILGLWWVTDSTGQNDMWRWLPTSRMWLDTLGGRIAASSAHAAGWRCVGPAVPPSGQDAPTAELRDRIARAVACLDAAPDPRGVLSPTFLAILAAKRAAWVVLTEGQAPEPVKAPAQVQGRMPGKREGR